MIQTMAQSAGATVHLPDPLLPLPSLHAWPNSKIKYAVKVHVSITA